VTLAQQIGPRSTPPPYTEAYLLCPVPNCLTPPIRRSPATLGNTSSNTESQLNRHCSESQVFPNQQLLSCAPLISALATPFPNQLTGEHLQPILRISIKLDFPFPCTSEPTPSRHGSQTVTPLRTPSSIATAHVLLQNG
jgi:hypothetical protein